MRRNAVNRRWLVLALTVMGGLWVSPAFCADAAQPPAVIVAYVFPQENQLRDGEIAANKLTRINYAFANISHGRIVNGFSHDDANLAALVALKRQNPALTVLVSVGGWLWSGDFSDMALTPHSRSVFISSVVEYVRRHQLDGLDIDWEYPGMEGSTRHFRPEDKHNFTSLIKELRARFDKLERELHRPLFLTVAAGASQGFLDHTEMDVAVRYLDTVNLMTYDYYEPDSDSITGHHAPLFANPADPKKASADASVVEFEEAGVPADKIVLGVPFYGHVWGQVPETNHGLFQPGKEIPHSYAQFHDGPLVMQKNGFVRYWDSTAGEPYLYNAEQHIFMSYDDPQSLALKCKYVLDHRLKGIMFWDYESDSTGTLLDALDVGLGKSTGAQGEIK